MRRALTLAFHGSRRWWRRSVPVVVGGAFTVLVASACADDGSSNGGRPTVSAAGTMAGQPSGRQSGSDSLPGPVTVAPGSRLSAVVLPSNGAVEAFWRTPDNDLAHATVPQSGSVRVELLGTVLTSDPTAVVAAGGVKVYWAGADDRLWSVGYTPDAGWGPPRSSELGPLAGSPGAVASEGGRVDVFWRDADHQLVMASTNGDGWEEAQVLGGDLASDPRPVAGPPEVVEVLWRGSDGNLWHHRREPSTGWSPALNLGMSVPGPPAVVSDPAGAIDTFWRGSDGGLRHAYRVAGDGWYGAVDRGGTLTTEPTAAITESGVIRVVWGGTYGSLGQHWYMGVQWEGPQLVAFPGIAGALTAVGRPNGQLELFGVDAAHRPWHAFWTPTTRWIGPIPLTDTSHN